MKHMHLVKPILAVIAVTVAVPLVTQAATTVIKYRGLHDAAAGSSSSEDLTYDIYTPRSTQRDLFDAMEFRLQRRQRKDERNGIVPPEAPVKTEHEAAPDVNPCDPAVSSSASSSASSVRMLDFHRDLTKGQQSELRRQLRIGGCPYDGVDEGYRLLCEDMLKKQQAVHPLRVGPSTPLQSQDEFLRSGGDLSQ